MENGIDIVFENSESVFIPREYIFIFDITSSSDNLSNMTYFKIIDKMELAIQKEVEVLKDSNNNFLARKEKSIINRLKRCDIAQIHVYTNGIHYPYIPKYNSDYEFGVNKNETVHDSDTLIMISIT